MAPGGQNIETTLNFEHNFPSLIISPFFSILYGIPPPGGRPDADQKNGLEVTVPTITSSVEIDSSTFITTGTGRL